MEYSDKEYIKSFRKMISNETIMTDAEHFALWNYLLLTVAWKECYANFGGHKIKLNAGQFVYGRKAIADKLRISESKTQRVLKKFEIEQMIEQQTSSKNRLITILNWSSYQSSEQQVEQQMNNKRTTNEQQMNTEEEYKNIRSKEDKNNTKILCQEILDYLNLKTSRKFTLTEAHLKHIKARIEEGHTLDEFKQVIDYKCDEWLSDKNYSQYLRPQTLFGNKFESYLNSKPVKKVNKVFDTWGVIAK